METDKNKSNKKFMILSFFGILMVVSGHLGGTTIEFFDNFFPKDSFFMPMFIFVSGYFFKDKYLKSFKSFFCKKCKKLLVYYLLWGLFYAIVMKLLFEAGLTKVDIPFTFKTILVDPIISYPRFLLNLPSWFLITLFFVEILYWIIRKISQKKIYNITVFIIFIAANIFSIYIAKNVDFSKVLLFAMKIMFFMFFYILGFYYKLYFEKKDEKINPILIMVILMIVNAIILKIQPDIQFFSLFQMQHFKNSNLVIPIITGVTGIYFFLKLSQLLTDSLKNNKLVNLISRYTKGICMHHLFCMYCFSIIIYFLNMKFDFEAYNNNSFLYMPNTYFYCFNNNTFSIIYLLIGIFGSIGIEKIVEKVLDKLEGKKLWRKLKSLNFLANH